jgi:hypothetical protein
MGKKDKKLIDAG